MFCSPNVSEEDAAKLSLVLGVSLTKKLEKYLGHHIAVDGRNKKRHKDLLPRIKNRVDGCKLKCLLRAGRITLAQSVLASISIFNMQLECLLAWVHKEMDKSVRKCVWGSSSGDRGVHLLSWEELCKPKKTGGVNLRSAEDVNCALLAKLA